MELYAEILTQILAKEKIEVSFPNVTLDAGEMVELACYQALRQIQMILENPSLDDRTCCIQIEEIVCLLEQLGSSGGGRHDF